MATAYNTFTLFVLLQFPISFLHVCLKTFTLLWCCSRFCIGMVEPLYTAVLL